MALSIHIGASTKKKTRSTSARQTVLTWTANSLASFYRAPVIGWREQEQALGEYWQATGCYMSHARDKFAKRHNLPANRPNGRS